MDHMEFSISLPPYAEFTNAGMEWTSMKQRLNAHGSYSSSAHKHRDGLVKAFLINIAAEQVQGVFNMFGLSYDEVSKFSQILQHLEDVFVPRFLIIYNRFKFFTCRQALTDKFDDFLRDLLNWSENCEFGDLRDILLKDCITTGIPDCSVRQRLLETEELDFTKTIEICRAVEQRQKLRHALVNTNQVIFVDASMETVNVDKSPVETEYVKNRTKEFKDASTNTKPDDFPNEKDNIHAAGFVEDNDKLAMPSKSVDSEESVSEPCDVSEILHNCETENNNGSCSNYRVANVTSERTKTLRRSKRHKPLDGSSFSCRLKINNSEVQRKKEENSSGKKLKIVKAEPVLIKTIDLKEQEDGSIAKLKINESDSEINKNSHHKKNVECSNEKNKKFATISEPQDQNVLDSKLGKTLKLSLKALVDKHRSNNNHTGETTNAKDNELTCSFCGKSFPDKVSILSHVQKTHGRKHFRKVSLKCRICKTVFVDIATLRKHRLIHRGERKFKCDFCPAQFGNPSHLKVHMRMHTGERPFTCETCGASYPEASKLKAHMRKHTGEKPYHCSVCSRTFAWTAAYTRHMRIHTGERPYTCEFCGVNFADFTSLQRHIRTHTLEKPYHCEKCNAKFSDPSALKLHSRTHNGQRPYVCGTCDNSFVRSQHLKEHMKLHTGEKPFSCETCGAKFLEASKLKSHSRKHTGEKPYLCKTCGTRFAWTAAFTRHMRTHTMEKPYVCDFCDSRYADHSTLTRHRRTHTGERPYTCKICSTSFADNSSLHRHMRIHTGEKTYICDVCGSSFAVKSYLVRHMRTHTGEKPYKCDLCVSKFTDSSKLNRHKKIHSKVLSKQGKQEKSESKQQQHYEQLQPVQQLPTGGVMQHTSVSKMQDSWQGDQHLLSAMHHLENPIIIPTTLLPLK